MTTLRRRLLEATHALTTPLLPADYLGALDRRLSTREATGTIVAVRPEADGAATVVIQPRPGWGGHAPGQYLRIGAEIGGVRHWRAYSITSEPGERRVSITVKRVPDGVMSPWLVASARRGARVFLGEVEGTFGLPDPVPPKLLAVTAGSGITPVMALLRELDRRDAVGDVVHVHSARAPERVIFGEQLRELARRRSGYVLHERATGAQGRLTPRALDALVPDWPGRATFLSGPPAMIDAFAEHHRRQRGAALYVERFQPVIGEGHAAVGAGGRVTFRAQAVDAPCDAGVSILVGGERAGAVLPFGCRMGICHTCVGRLASGRVRDLRTGELAVAAGQSIRTCVNAPEGPVEVEL